LFVANKNAITTIKTFYARTYIGGGGGGSGE